MQRARDVVVTLLSLASVRSRARPRERYRELAEPVLQSGDVTSRLRAVERGRHCRGVRDRRGVASVNENDTLLR